MGHSLGIPMTSRRRAKTVRVIPRPHRQTLLQRLLIDSVSHNLQGLDTDWILRDSERKRCRGIRSESVAIARPLATYSLRGSGKTKVIFQGDSQYCASSYRKRKRPILIICLWPPDAPRCKRWRDRCSSRCDINHYVTRTPYEAVRISRCLRRMKTALCTA